MMKARTRKARSGEGWVRLKRNTGEALSLAQFRFSIHPGASNWNSVIDAMLKFQEADNGINEFYASISDKSDRDTMRSYLGELSISLNMTY